MPGLGLSADDTWRVVAYLRSLNAGENEPIPGNAPNGESLFHGKAGCVQCHRVNGRGSRLAPDLSAVGGWKVKDLRQQLLAPGTKPGYFSELVEVETTGGRVVRGLRRNEDTFSIQLFGADEEFHLFRKRDLAASVRYIEKSLMPSYEGKLAAAEVDDVVAFLKTLREPGDPGVRNRGVGGHCGLLGRDVLPGSALSTRPTGAIGYAGKRSSTRGSCAIDWKNRPPIRVKSWRCSCSRKARTRHSRIQADGLRPPSRWAPTTFLPACAASSPPETPRTNGSTFTGVRL